MSWVCLFVFMALLSGCEDLIPPRPPLNPPPQAAASAPENKPQGGQEGGDAENAIEPLASFAGDWEDWYIHRIGNQVVGISHVSAESIIDATVLSAEHPDVRFERMERFVFRTGSTQFVRRISTTSVETHDGLIQNFETEAGTGPVTLRIQGKRNKDVMNIQMASTEGTEKQSLDWGDDTRGLFAVEQTLRRKPMENNERRELRVFNPSMKVMGRVELACPGDVSIAKFDGEFELMREVQVRQFQEDQMIDQYFLWTDKAGVVQKTLRPQMRIESFRTDRATAGELFTQREDGAVLVSIKGALKKEKAATQVAFVIVSSELAAENGDDEEDESADDPESTDGPDAATQEYDTKAPPEGMVDPAVNQSTRRVKDGLQVLVARDGVAPKGFAAFEDQPVIADRQPTALFDANDPSVERMALALGDLETDQLVIELANVVKNVLSLSPQTGLNKASRVLRSGSGGELDHSVLLAAMLRSRGIASRIALGLKLLPDQTSGEGDDARNVMKLSSWVIAWSGNAWVTIDPLTGEINRADRLCLRQPVDEQNLMIELTSVFRRIADIEIEIRGARYE